MFIEKILLQEEILLVKVNLITFSILHEFLTRLCIVIFEYVKVLLPHILLTRR